MLEEQEGVVAVKVEERRGLAVADPQEIADELDLGTIARETLDDRTAGEFQKANWLFVHPSDRVRSALDTNDPPDGTETVGRVLVDEEGSTRIDTHVVSVKLGPDLSREDAEKLLREQGARILRSLGFATNLYRVAAPVDVTTFEFIDRLRENRAVEYAEPDLVEYVEVREQTAMTRAGYSPNDPRYGQQWQWERIDAEQAWTETRGAGVTVGVVDTGFDVDHEDLKDGLADATGYYETSGMGEEFVVGTTNYPDSNHGTFCAGMAAAVGDNGVGVCGAAMAADLLPVACLPDQVGSQTTLALAISYAADPTVESAATDEGLDESDGADVIACSLGPKTGASWTMHSVLKDAIDSAVEDGRDGKGTPVFWAASNGNVTIDGEDGTDQVVAYENTVAVGRSTSDDTEHGSAYGPKLDFLAPGVDVFSTGSNDTYRTSTGTSFAAPCAAGVAGLVVDAAPEMDWQDVLWTMIDTCDQIGGVTYEDDHHDRYGFGRINAGDAVAEAAESTATAKPSISGPDAVGPNDGPPTFTVDTAGRSHYLVELATRPELFNYEQHGSDRTPETFFPLYDQDNVGRHTATEYTPPAEIWDRLLADDPTRVYYRVHVADGETGWSGWQVSTADQDYDETPAIVVEPERVGMVPTIDGPDTVAVDGGPPTFNVDSGGNSHYVVELATRSKLFDQATHGAERSTENFYPLYGEEPAPRHTELLYRPPTDVWDRLMGPSPAKVYYRVFGVDGETGWTNWQVSTPDAAYDRAPSISLAGGRLLQASVGRGGENRPEDVRALKERLVGLGFDWLSVDARVTDDLISAINLFQSITNGRDTVHGDGRVDVPGPMYAWLTALNPPHWQQMPVGSRDGSKGFYNVEVAEQTHDDHDYGTNWLATTIENAGSAYQDDYRAGVDTAAPITVNDASPRRGGDTPDHSGHETGLVCDLRLPLTDGIAPGGTTFRDGDYDRDAMRAMLEAINDQDLFNRAFFNDPDLVAQGLCTKLAGHDNHVHIEIHPPERQESTEREATEVVDEAREEQLVK